MAGSGLNALRAAAPVALVMPAFRLAWHARNLWHRMTRPLTMGVRAIILNDTGSVLLIRHSYIAGWHFPGGGVGKGETLVEAMCREVREEVGLIVRDPPLQPLGVFARFRHGASDHVAVFLARDWSGTPQADGLEILEARFFPRDSLPDDTSPATRRRLAELAGERPRSEQW